MWRIIWEWITPKWWRRWSKGLATRLQGNRHQFATLQRKTSTSNASTVASILFWPQQEVSLLIRASANEHFRQMKFFGIVLFIVFHQGKTRVEIFLDKHVLFSLFFCYWMLSHTTTILLNSYQTNGAKNKETNTTWSNMVSLYYFVCSASLIGTSGN